MDTLAPPPQRIQPTPVVVAIPTYESLNERIMDTAHRIQTNVQNMPLTSLFLAVAVGVMVGSALTRATYHPVR